MKLVKTLQGLLLDSAIEIVKYKKDRDASRLSSVYDLASMLEEKLERPFVAFRVDHSWNFEDIVSAHAGYQLRTVDQMLTEAGYICDELRLMPYQSTEQLERLKDFCLNLHNDTLTARRRSPRYLGLVA